MMMIDDCQGNNLNPYPQETQSNSLSGLPVPYPGKVIGWIILFKCVWKQSLTYDNNLSKPINKIQRAFR